MISGKEISRRVAIAAGFAGARPVSICGAGLGGAAGRGKAVSASGSNCSTFGLPLPSRLSSAESWSGTIMPPGSCGASFTGAASEWITGTADGGKRGVSVR